MTKMFSPGKGTRFEFDEENHILTLKSLFGMVCSYNGRQAENSRSGLCLVCLDTERFEGKLLRYDCRQEGKTFTFNVFDEERTFSFGSVWECDDANGVIACSMRVTNTSRQAKTLRRAFPRWTFCPGRYQVYSQLNRWSYENQGSFQELKGADIVLGARAARSTVGATPYCVLRDMENGSAVAFHVLPRGNWRIRVHSDIVSDEAPVPVVEAGLSDEDLFLALAPGESLELPKVLLQHIPGGCPENGAAPLHRHLLEHILPASLHTPPVIYNTWLYRFGKFTREQLREQLAAARQMGVETFVIDAGWYKEKGVWQDAPNGPFDGDMASFADEVRAQGLKFGFWMEPETWSRTAPIRALHPEWFPKGSSRIDLTIPEAARHFHDCIADNVRKYKAEYIKIDYNLSVEYDASGAELAGYCAALEDIFRKLHGEFPELVIENCASGALRCDLATSAVFDQAFVSDNADPAETLAIRQGAMLRLHPMRILNWVALRPAPERYTPVSKLEQALACAAATWDEAALYPLHFAMISGLLGILSFSGDLAAMPEDTRRIMAEYVAFYKENREWLVRAAVYPLTRQEDILDYEAFRGFQVLREDRKEALVFVFSNGMSRRNCRRFRLKGLDSGDEFNVERVFTTDVTPYGAPEAPVPAAELMDEGLEFLMMENMHIRHHASVYRLAAM